MLFLSHPPIEIVDFKICRISCLGYFIWSQFFRASGWMLKGSEAERGHSNLLIILQCWKLSPSLKAVCWWDHNFSRLVSQNWRFDWKFLVKITYYNMVDSVPITLVTYRIGSIWAPGFYFSKWIFGWGSIDIWPTWGCIWDGVLLNWVPISQLTK